MSASPPLNPAVVSCLSRLSYRQDAARRICIIPLSGIYWEDEIPELRDLMKFAEEDRLQIFRLLSIRYDLWDGKSVTPEDQQFWDAARAQVPSTPIFQRITLSDGDKRAHKEARATCEREFEQFLADADEVTLTDLGSGIQQFSARFDLTKPEFTSTPNQPVTSKQSWWKRLFSRKD
jgi:hypothetical protein